MIRVGFFETNRGGLDQRPRWRMPPFAVPGANSRRAVGIVMYRLAGNPARFMRGIFWKLFLTPGETRTK
jgi:hypothetical protein